MKRLGEERSEGAPRTQQYNNKYLCGDGESSPNQFLSLLNMGNNDDEDKETQLITQRQKEEEEDDETQRRN